MIEISEDWRYLILVEYATYPWAPSVIIGSIQDSRCTLVNEMMVYKGRILMVPGSSVKQVVPRAFHDSPLYVAIPGSLRHTDRSGRDSLGKARSQMFNSMLESALFAPTLV